MFNPSRDQSRQFFIEAWRKHRAGEVVSPLEAMVVEIVAAHPEYHALIESPEAALTQDFSPERAETNPFLHLALHLALEEQLSIDQPPGIRQAYRRVLKKRSDEHEAKHIALEALAEMIWETQRYGKPFAVETYLEQMLRKA